MKPHAWRIAALGIGMAAANPVSAVDRFDVQVCEAAVGVAAQSRCYADLKLPARCAAGTAEERLACQRKAAQASVLAPAAVGVPARPGASKPAAPVPAASTPLSPIAPLRLKIKGGNWNALVSVDPDCLYTGESDYGSAGPSYAHLSQMKLVIRVNPTHALLACKDGTACAIQTLPGDWDVAAHRRGPAYTVRTKEITVLTDYGPYPASDDAIERQLGGAVRGCQQSRPAARWESLLRSAR